MIWYLDTRTPSGGRRNAVAQAHELLVDYDECPLCGLKTVTFYALYDHPPLREVSYYLGAVAECGMCKMVMELDDASPT